MLNYLLIFLCCGMLCRVFWVCTNTEYAQTASAQAEYEVPLPGSRGDFYDCNGKKLTGIQEKWYALCVPGETGYTELFPYLSYENQSTLYERRNSAVPFLIEVDRGLSSQGVYCYCSAKRYLEPPIAVQMIGYLDGEDRGVTGLERAFDDLLSQLDNGVLQCAVTAQGTLIEESELRISTADKENATGVQLTLDANIQRLCEGIAQGTMEKGCILVMNTESGALLASVSVPEFDPYHVEKSIEADDTSLINRPLAAYNAGSVFKIVVAAAALEQDVDWYTWDCEGSTEVAGQTYRCAQSRAHGMVNLRQALEESCNCYFVHLGQLVGSQVLLDVAKAFGFGESTALAGGLKSNAGNLPSREFLENEGQLAMFSFGQGELLVTPLQISVMTNAIANGGESVTPVIVKGVRTKEADFVPTANTGQTKRVCSSRTADLLRKMLVSVVEEGIGGDAMPKEGGAGGKTGTAQTGQYSEGDELLNYWFTGFYPAEEPRYTITVLQDGVLEPQTSSAAIFAQVADGLYVLENC